MQLKVGLYASNAIALAGLLALLQSNEVDIVAKVDELNGVKTLLEMSTVDAVILELPEIDLSMIQQLQDLFGTGLEASPSFQIPACVIVTTTMIPDSVSIALILATGIGGLLPHTVTSEELESTISAATNGLRVLHPAFSDLWEDIPAKIQTQESSQQLSDRELQVLDTLSLGLSNKQIASRLYISEHTVKFHISSILSKLGVSGRTEAVAAGIRQGLIKL